MSRVIAPQIIRPISRHGCNAFDHFTAIHEGHNHVAAPIRGTASNNNNLASVECWLHAIAGDAPDKKAVHRS